MITFQKIDLVTELKRRRRELANITDFDTRLASSYKKAIADYMLQLRNEEDPFAIGTTFGGTAPSTGSAITNTSIGDLFEVTLDTTAEAVQGDMIWVWNGTAMKQCIRIRPQDIVISGADATLLGFCETKSKIFIYVKDAEITTPASMHYYFWRTLSVSLATDSTELDILAKDFAFIVQRTMEYITEDLSI